MATTTVQAGAHTQVVLDALRWLDAHCDGAVEKDGRGFNKPDSFRGKQLASRPFLNSEEAAEALGLLHKYVGQLALGGIVLPEANRVLAEARAAEAQAGTIRLRQGVLLVEFPYLKAHVA